MIIRIAFFLAHRAVGRGNMDWGSEKYCPTLPLILLFGVVIFLQSQAACAPPTHLHTFLFFLWKCVKPAYFWEELRVSLVLHKELLNAVVYFQPYSSTPCEKDISLCKHTGDIALTLITLYLTWILLCESGLLCHWATGWTPRFYFWLKQRFYLNDDV